LTAAENKSRKILATPLELNTANGEVSVEWEIKIRVKEIGNELVTVLLLDDTPAVLSLGRLCDTNGFTFHWSSTEAPYLQKPGGRKIYCPVEQNVPYTTPANNATPSPAEPDECPAKVEDSKVANKAEPDENRADEPQDKIPDSEEEPVPESEQQESSESENEEKNPSPSPTHKVPMVGRKIDKPKAGHNTFTHFPKDTNCSICQRCKISRAPCTRQKRHQGKPDDTPVPKHFGDSITADLTFTANDEPSRKGETVALVFQDRASHWI
jgi:hypothetical protein